MNEKKEVITPAATHVRTDGDDGDDGNEVREEEAVRGVLPRHASTQEVMNAQVDYGANVVVVPHQWLKMACCWRW